MKQEYVYVGKHSVIGEREFSSVGQHTTFSEDEYTECLSGGALFVTREDFDREFSGFDAEEFARYTNPFFFGEPSVEYMQRLEACRDIARKRLAGK